METIDLVGIGAIVFDYICYCDNFLDSEIKNLGQENLNCAESFVRSRIEKAANKPYNLDGFIGGSAYLAVKSAKYIDATIKTSYVGVVGTPTEQDRLMNIHDPSREFDHLNSKEWLFTSTASPGLSLARQYKGDRGTIDIYPGANSELFSMITAKDCESSFVEMLAKSRWIHLSSLSDFAQFCFIVEKVREAQERNPCIFVSLDPGYEYTFKYRAELMKIIDIADYLFLNKLEMTNLLNSSALADKPTTMKSFFDVFKCSGKTKRTAILKASEYHTIWELTEHGIHEKIVNHTPVPSSKIRNEAGAGDVFAGGVIASMLSGDNNDIIDAVRVGSLASTARLQCDKEADVFSSIRKATNNDSD